MDTGANLNAPYLRGATGRIIERKDWAELSTGASEPDPNRPDNDSHGTDIIALLHQIAPDCDIYFGRVAFANGTMIAADKIAEVPKI